MELFVSLRMESFLAIKLILFYATKHRWGTAGLRWSSCHVIPNNIAQKASQCVIYHVREKRLHTIWNSEHRLLSCDDLTEFLNLWYTYSQRHVNGLRGYTETKDVMVNIVRQIEDKRRDKKLL